MLLCLQRFLIAVFWRSFHIIILIFFKKYACFIDNINFKICLRLSHLLKTISLTRPPRHTNQCRMMDFIDYSDELQCFTNFFDSWHNKYSLILYEKNRTISKIIAITFKKNETLEYYETQLEKKRISEVNWKFNVDSKFIRLLLNQ